MPSSSLWITCISCKYSFIDFIYFVLSCFVSIFFQTNKYGVPFKLFTWFLWELKHCGKKEAQLNENYAVMKLLLLSLSFIACVYAEFPVYDLQMQQSQKKDGGVFF